MFVNGKLWDIVLLSYYIKKTNETFVIFLMALNVGLEPTTQRLTAVCSTD